MKKGQTLSMNVIIIAALALLVLVIVSMIFMSRTTTFVRESKSCMQMGGTCKDLADSCPAGMVEQRIGGAQCLNSDGTVDDTRKCCMTGESIS